MANEIRVPSLGESVTEATVGQWFKKPGDAIAVDEPLVELETDKVTMEVPAPVAGTLGEILAADGETVEVGALLGTVSEGAAAASAAPAPKETANVAAAPKPAEPAPSNPAPVKSAMPAAPSAAKMMAEQNVSPDQINGSGKRGQILKEDVMAAVASAQNAPAAARAPSTPQEEAREERVRMTKLRQTIARRLKEAQNSAAMLTTFNEVDMAPVMNLRKSYKELFEKKHGVKLGFMGFFTKAVCQALKEIPAVNAEIDGTDVIYKQYCNIGVAVGTPKGLVVPVVRDADQMSIAGIEKSISELGVRARDGKLGIEDMQGGTFTISNGGSIRLTYVDANSKCAHSPPF